MRECMVVMWCLFCFMYANYVHIHSIPFRFISLQLSFIFICTVILCRQWENAFVSVVCTKTDFHWFDTRFMHITTSMEICLISINPREWGYTFKVLGVNIIYSFIHYLHGFSNAVTIAGDFSLCCSHLVVFFLWRKG